MLLGAAGGGTCVCATEGAAAQPVGGDGPRESPRYGQCSALVPPHFLFSHLSSICLWSRRTSLSFKLVALPPLLCNVWTTFTSPVLGLQLLLIPLLNVPLQQFGIYNYSSFLLCCRGPDPGPTLASAVGVWSHSGLPCRTCFLHPPLS